MDLDDTHLKTGRYDPRTYWNARARTSDGNTHQAVCVFRYSDDLNLAAERVQRHFLRRMLRQLDLRQKAVLELGCGVGRWLDLIQSFGGHYTGIDVSDEMIRLARARRPNGKFIQIDDADFPFSDNSFDLVFSVTVLHHNAFDEQEHMLREVVRILKPNGHALLMEDIVHDRSRRSSFNMYPRTFEDWVTTVTTGGRMSLVSRRFARWWFMADRAERVMRRLLCFLSRRQGARAEQGPMPSERLCSLIVLAANSLDIAVQRLLPRRLAVNAVMLFKKAQTTGRGKGA